MPKQRPTSDEDAQAELVALGQRITELRERAGITQTRLGELVGLHSVTISRMESGKQAMTVTSLAKFARALNTTPSALLAFPPEASISK